MNETCFFILFRSEAGERLARTVIESLRAFGGPLRHCAVWAFVLDPDRASRALPGIEGVHRFPLAVEESCAPYPFAEKVYACAKAAVDAGRDLDLGPVQICEVCGHTLEGDVPDKCPVCGAARDKYVTFA